VNKDLVVYKDHRVRKEKRGLKVYKDHKVFKEYREKEV
jgi:hypothetical protein